MSQAHPQPGQAGSATSTIEPDQPIALEKAGGTEAPASISSPPATDTKYGWLVVLGAFFNLMLSIGTTTTYGVYLQEYKLVEFPDTPSSFLSWIGTLQFSMMCFFGIGVGVLCEYVDTRILSAFGALVSGLALIIASFCNSPWKLLLTQGLLYGFGGSFLYITGLTLPPQWFSKYRALATGIAIAGSGIGGLWLSFATRAMTSNLSRQWSLRITGLVIIGVCGATCLLMKMRFKPEKRQRIVDLTVLRDKRFVLLFLGAMFGASGFYIPYYFMPSYSVTVLGKDASWGTNVSSIMNGTGIAGRVLMGILGDKIGSLNTLWMATLISCLSILVLWLPFDSTGTFISAAAVFGFCSGAIVSLIPVVTANIFGVRRLPSIIGLLMIAYMTGGLVSSPPAGAMLDKYGHGRDFNSLIIYTGVLLAASVACQTLLRLMTSRQLWHKV
ncbi:hypothetical protein GGI04_004463 [Coemansia thaxteri]|uniref:Major facilitator superfamily (MFS) profile domain-containing protein n=1 Tax=Coemansia thaxteri TaxID=2663907 RepID=A0A9W8EIS4_9FUNG|nr:hypothetical protein GGI04_004463 [Coemansia thaxteri]KAJ2005192.1 hypothetical protein H4R26_002079 [Coemansia thaxteri]KAJ2473625.1 hypothetical protein GGI02_000731 [Coemansia sp. RSA 2322]KAJ2487955.1 hypothetical protein EV174_000192 [Coemansia sp. RSA 2320]